MCWRSETVIVAATTQVGQVHRRRAVVNIKHQDAQFVRYTLVNW